MEQHKGAGNAVIFRGYGDGAVKVTVQPAPLYRGETAEILELLLKRDKTVMAVIGEIAHHIGEITDGIFRLHSILLIGEFRDYVKNYKR